MCTELQFEDCPKWLAIREVLIEIEAEIENNPQISSANEPSSACSVMIAAQDDRMCSQIRDVRFHFFFFTEFTALITWY